MQIDLNKLAAPIGLVIALSGVVGGYYVTQEKVARLESDVAKLLTLSDNNMNDIIRINAVASMPSDVEAKLHTLSEESRALQQEVADAWDAIEDLE